MFKYNKLLIENKINLANRENPFPIYNQVLYCVFNIINKN